MYQIICDNKYVLYDSRSTELRVIDPTCELEINKTGTLSFKLPPNHPYYDSIQKLKSEISLYQDGEWLFSGRVLNDEIDFRKFKIIQVEGELGYLLDTIQKSKVYHLTGSTRVKDYLSDLISIHNAQVDSFKRFNVGKVTVNCEDETLYKISNYEDTLSLLNSELIDKYQGYLIPRNVKNTKYIDYLTAKDFELNNQIIEFGKNLINLNQYLKGEDIATCIIPLGIKVGELEGTEEGDTVEEKLDLSGVASFTEGTIKHDTGTNFIYDSDAVKKYGYIYKVIDFGDIDDTNTLIKKAKEQLNYYKLHEFKIELTAFDLSLLDVNYESIKLGQKIKVISLPHKLNKELIVMKMSINLTQPDKTTITLTSEERTSKEIDSVTKKTDEADKNIKSIDKNVGDIDKNLKDNYLKRKDLQNMIDNGNIDLSKGIQRSFDNNKVNLSAYAKIVDVNQAFNELANLLKGV